jgi:hypothetical protein
LRKRQDPVFSKIPGKIEINVDSIALTEDHVFSGMRPEKLAMNN